MYEILMDGKELWYPGDKECVVLSPSLTQALNDSGYIEFKIPSANPLYNRVFECVSMIQVLKDNREIFYGVVKETSVNFRQEKRVYAVGILSFLADSIQPQKKFQDITPYDFISELVQRHNEQVEERKRFEVGVVTVHDSNDSLYRFTNYEDTLTALREKICDRLDGYLRVRRIGNRNILDVVTLTDYGKNCAQAIEFGENLLDYAESTTTDEIATAVLPRGHQLEESPIEGLTAYLTVESVNDGKDYIYNEDAVKRFGWIKRVVDFEDITLPENLIKKAREWLTEKQFAGLTLSLNAVDLSMMNGDIQSFELGDYVHARAEPYGMDAWFPVREKTTCLSDISRNTIVLSSTSRKSYTQQQAVLEKSIAQKMLQKSDILQAAKENASKLIQMATNGYIVLKMDTNGNPCEFLIMDSKDINEAHRVWRWNLNGFGYSSTGYNGEYGLAITMDGAIVADFITAGTMHADRIKGGVLTLGGINNSAGVLSIVDGEENEIGRWDKDGIKINAGSIIADAIKGGTLSIGGTDDAAGTLTVLDAEGNIVATMSKDGVDVKKGNIRGAGVTIGGTDDTDGTLTVLDAEGNIVATMSKDGVDVRKGSISGAAITSEDGNYWAKINAGSITVGHDNTVTGKIKFVDGGLEFRGNSLNFCMDTIKCGTSMNDKSLETAYTGDIKYSVKQTNGSIKNIVMEFRNGILMDNGELAEARG